MGGNNRVLLIGIMDSQGDPAVDGGRREAVRKATMADTERWSQEYSSYYDSYARTRPPAEQQAGQQSEPQAA